MINIETLPKRRSSWIKIANVPRSRIGWELEDCTDVTDRDLKLCRAWIKQVKSGKVVRADGQLTCGKGLLIVGEPGHGKTTLSVALLQEILRTFDMEDFVVSDGHTIVKPCYFTTYNELLDLKGYEISGTATDEQERLLLGILGECKDDAYNVRVLVIDDIGKEHTSASGWQANLLHHVLRTRFNNGLPTIVTTNIPVKSWEGIYGSATGSFIHEAFATIELKSVKGDLRKQ